MALSLNKGGNLSLTKTDPKLNNLLIGLGWEAPTSLVTDFDLDASVFLLDSTGKVRGDHDFIFYNQLESDNGAVIHTADSTLDQDNSADELIHVNLVQLPSDINKVVVSVTIYEALSRQQYFGQVRYAFIRLINADSGTEVVRFDLPEDYSLETAMVFGEIYRHNHEWKFRAVGQGYAGGLEALCQQYGVEFV